MSENDVMVWGKDLPKTSVSLLSQGNLFSFEYPQVLAYHGKRSECGAAVAFALAAHLNKENHGPVDRDRVTLWTGVYGEGLFDGLELLYRCTTRKALTYHPLLGAQTPAPPGPGEGYFYFRIQIDHTEKAYYLTPSKALEDYMALCAKEKDETEERKTLRRNFVRSLLEEDSGQPFLSL